MNKDEFLKDKVALELYFFNIRDFKLNVLINLELNLELKFYYNM